MTIQVLISAIVRQTTVLIAQLATSGGARAPLAQVASQVFLELVEELERQGVSRKVSADMFGMGLRTYQRKIQRLTESSTEAGRSLWSAVLDFLRDRDIVTRADVLQRFHRDDETQVRSVLHDLVESGLVFVSGSGTGSTYRIATEQELGRLRQLRRNEGLDELVWVFVFREGPLSLSEIARRAAVAEQDLESVLGRLLSVGRILREGELYRASEFVIPLGASVGWEAAVFDHFQAAVQTICQRLRQESARRQDTVGGSTYSFEVWDGHPLADQVRGTLAQLRELLGDLRQQVEEHNCRGPRPRKQERVAVYVGQNIVELEETHHVD